MCVLWVAHRLNGRKRAGLSGRKRRGQGDAAGGSNSIAFHRASMQALGAALAGQGCCAAGNEAVA